MRQLIKLVLTRKDITKYGMAHEKALKDITITDVAVTIQDIMASDKCVIREEDGTEKALKDRYDAGGIDCTPRNIVWIEVPRPVDLYYSDVPIFINHLRMLRQPLAA